MNRQSIALLFFFAVVPAAALLAQPQASVPSSSFVDPQGADKANAREDELYSSGTEALDDNNYDEAVSKFDQVAKMRGRKADAALYWKAYALNKTGNKSQALATINELRKTFLQSRWLREAGILETEMKGAAANPNDLPDEETKLIAINALMNADPEKAVPFLDKIIHGNYSTKLKEKALFVLSQSNSDQAQQMLLSVAKAGNDPNLQKRAIRNLGMNGNSRNRAALKEIYTSSSDPQVKKAVFQGWLMSGDKEDVLAVVKQEKSPELRREAIRYLGMMGGRAELREIYKSSADPETREAVVQGMLLCGDSQGLAEIANTEKDPNVLDKAINTLGMVGGPDTLATLTSIYNSHDDIQTKKRVINAMFLHNAAKEMVTLARKETNPELKRAWIQKLSLMHSPEITEYMMEILNK